MATISQTMFSNAFQCMGILIFDKISLEFFLPKVPIDSEKALL